MTYESDVWQVLNSNPDVEFTYTDQAFAVLLPNRDLQGIGFALFRLWRKGQADRRRDGERFYFRSKGTRDR